MFGADALRRETLRRPDGKAGAALRPAPLRARLARDAVFALALRTPHWSAARRITPGQRRMALRTLGAAAVGAIVAPSVLVWLAAALFTAGFSGLIMFRVWAACTARPLRIAAPVPDADLPTYTVIAPLYREARVAGPLIAALGALDYPPERLDILLVAEADDRETLAALRAHAPPAMRVIKVPRAGPRTKPKALTYALAFARGEYVTIYDAEDRPDPAQLRAAAAAFRDGGPSLVCVQAPLTYYNAGENFITRCFQLEYAVHFRVLLPALVRMGAPAPLGGTSNHFRANALRAAGGWDPFNVTEDADLGFRLAACGGRIGMIAPPTGEEATCRPWPWIRQRSRWLKGYAQTILVHTRRAPEPAPAPESAAASGVAGRARRTALKAMSLWLTLGGPLAAAILHGPALLWLLYACLRPVLFGGPAPSPLAFAILGSGYASSALAAVAAARLTKDRSLLLAMLLTPFYWPLQSVAAFMALRQLVVAPFRWEKTEHGVSRLPQRAVPGTGDGAQGAAALSEALSRRSLQDANSFVTLCAGLAGGPVPAGDAGNGAEPAVHQ